MPYQGAYHVLSIVYEGSLAEELQMEPLYEDVRNHRHGLHSEKRMTTSGAVFVLQLVNMQTNLVEKEQILYNWNDYSQWYNKMRFMLQHAP